MCPAYLLQGYAWHFGALWASSSDQALAATAAKETKGTMEIQGGREGQGDIWGSYSTPLIWLLGVHNLKAPSRQLQSE